jgi:hypothetical protein
MSIRYFKVFLGHFEEYFKNSEKGPKLSEVNPRITWIPWSIAKISLKFWDSIAIDVINWLLGTIVGIGVIPDILPVTDSKVSIGYLMTSATDRQAIAKGLLHPNVTEYWVNLSL